MDFNHVFSTQTAWEAGIRKQSLPPCLQNKKAVVAAAPWGHMPQASASSVACYR